MLRLLFRRNRTNDLARLLLALDALAGEHRATDAPSCATGVSLRRTR